ncbi:MAG: hypothetical protein H6945_04080 [Zoogloeaceae bacterium]|nr:hypothetical protein [Rhodocyclaceae bacterium]MCP5234899.1 hypothetical protein [Zoogloeaceae bacterium]
MSTVLIAALIAGVVLIWLLLRLRGGASPTLAKAPQPERMSQFPYRCVSVVGGPNACSAVELVRGRRYLPDQAPPLPLPGCTASVCECTYRHHRDRRSRDRRNEWDPRQHAWNHDNSERRKKKRGRRHDD